MDGNVRSNKCTVHPKFLCLHILDFILAACDVEGNFMVVKVRVEITLIRYDLIDIQAYQYTDLLSCMLLDAYVRF
jgi:hypothetical protein